MRRLRVSNANALEALSNFCLPNTLSTYRAWSISFFQQDWSICTRIRTASCVHNEIATGAIFQPHTNETHALDAGLSWALGMRHEPTHQPLLSLVEAMVEKTKKRPERRLFACFPAEAVRFELTNPCGLPVFKTGAIDHSATLPSLGF